MYLSIARSKARQPFDAKTYNIRMKIKVGGRPSAAPPPLYGYGNVVEARFNGLNGIICAIIPVDRGVVQCAVKIDMPGCTGENEIRIDYAHLRAYEPLDSHGEDDQVAAYWKHTG